MCIQRHPQVPSFKQQSANVVHDSWGKYQGTQCFLLPGIASNGWISNKHKIGHQLLFSSKAQTVSTTHFIQILCKLTQMKAICLTNFIAHLYKSIYQDYEMVLSKIGVTLFLLSLSFMIHTQFELDTYFAHKKEPYLDKVFNYVKSIDLFLLFKNTYC